MTDESARLRARWRSQLQVQGEVTVPCLPSCIPESLELVENLVSQLGEPLQEGDRAQLETGITQLVNESFATGPYARLTLTFTSNPPPETGVDCQLNATIDTVPVPGLGTEPDAKVLELAQQWPPFSSRFLALGSGFQRNVSPLVEQGYAVVTREWRSFTSSQPVKSSDLQTQHFLDPLVRLEPASYHFAFAPDLMGAIGQTPERLRLLLAKLCDGLVSGGQILLGLWLSEEPRSPTTAEWLQWQGYWVLSRAELDALRARLPLQLLSCELAQAYEQEQRGTLPVPYQQWLQGEGLHLSESEGQDVQLYWVVWQRL